VLLRYDMVHLVWEEGHISGKQTVLASVLRAQLPGGATPSGCRSRVACPG
jgi:hypothetical protein